ncbi:sialate O-acetylesterase [Hymenobacter caeli]|uniref:Sialate O-acetylesterase n=1 Tax=Hymenobacter caeli TaxID=2735894 RepID=A0ABX2FSM5_9BACT|nr:sialate O-acetylesterase [Hymenobacter caeli]NRT19442.1 sialate O-acetylesterase [Hymenobacter caeli]
MPTRRSLLLPALLLALGASPAARAAVRLPALVGSHMVLQRDAKLPLWGWAAPGEQVSVTFRGKTYPAVPGGPDGRWQATLPPQPAGGPYTLTVRGQNTIELTDVLVGDVWLASGQSNMQFKVKDPNRGGYQPVQNADQEIAAANWPNLRLFTVNQTAAYRPQAEAPANGWQVCSPATIAEFSAVAYFFGRDLYQQYRVPMGLIADSWGGTPAEAWVSAEGLRAFPEFGAKVAAFSQRTTSLADDQRAFQTQQKAFQQSINTRDQGYLPGGKTWAAPDFDARAWATLAVPGAWEASPALAGYDGVVWFRKEIELTAADAARSLTLALGRIADADSTWFNGVKVGGTGGAGTPRAYDVPAALVHPGRNVIAVRVVDASGPGGFVGAPADLVLTTAARSLALAGAWQYRPGIAPADVPRPPVPGGAQMAPTALYNGMIAPMQPLAIKGVIWYQGETNAERAEQYRTLFPALIADWRAHWGYEFPFLFVQLANFNPALPQPAESDWAELREAQAGALALPRTGMATAIDLGDPADIHPHNKQEVGRRLALAARRVAYADPGVVASGPTYAGMAVAGPAVRLRFDHHGSGLRAPDGPLRGFAVAGADHKFYWATAQVQGDDVVVSSAEVPAPVAVRYDWATNPDGNLYNREGLPTVPFRTDTWPGVTAGRK